MAMEPKIPARVPPSCLQQPKRWWQHSSLLETCKEICLQNMIMPQNVIKKTVVYHVWSLSFAGKINLDNFWNRRSNPIASLGFVSCLLFMYFWSVCSIHPGKNTHLKRRNIWTKPSWLWVPWFQTNQSSQEIQPDTATSSPIGYALTNSWLVNLHHPL